MEQKRVKIILLGPPGAGKGTQAEIISETLAIPTISTGAMIREAIAEGSEIGKQAKAIVESGGLLPDETVIGIVKERIAKPDCAKGFILDGFPRTVAQAEALNAMKVDIDAALLITVDDETIIARMSGRRVCGKCGATFHVLYNAPKTADVCDKCGATLTIRADDQPNVVKDRLDSYHAQTEPLIAFYKNLGKLKTVVGQEKLEDTTALTKKTIDEIVSEKN